MDHLVEVYRCILDEDSYDPASADAHLELAWHLPMSARERGHMRVAIALAADNYSEAARRLADLLDADGGDLLALDASHRLLQRLSSEVLNRGPGDTRSPAARAP
jgi:hypothetical protein